ncbi:MAG: MBL fold metallo-hydrolase [Actinobacteria bacterium]|nr:MBL fold metallo-hydrolase [Actinomycetota bacterium]MBU1943216.1 MBL fold metallo-hydrolase [Actinomycetota bacterium]MBU2686225.1 MBL fold metallo-hydrolase [Actinomycetota bacterium]
MDTKDATGFTEEANRSFRGDSGLDWADTTDHEASRRGFIASLDDTAIRTEDGRCVWDLAPYSFLEREEPPATVNPSLWRQARLNMAHGLFQVTDRIYQVRGHDLSVISFIRGEKGWIVIDPLISAECASASLELVLEQVEKLPVTTVIYTHSHIDHFGGVKGVVSDEDVGAGRVRIVAPEGFLEAAVSENVMAGNAMGRRASYMYGSLLPVGPRGQVDAALGKRTSSGTVTLIPPTDYVRETGYEMTLDGVDLVFQVTPGTEAPAEMNFYFPGMSALCMAENCSHNMHNLLTLRGAQVRDARAWSHYLDEAIGLFSSKAELVFTSHHWPVWGRERALEYLKKQRDMYRYLHDQTVRMMNAGYTGIEIAEMLELPEELAREWYNRGYYGSVSHNVKAIYQRYMGWFDGNPASLHPIPPEEAGAKYVEFMGGADALLDRARAAFDNGEYRWVAQVVNHLVFAEPDNESARSLQADALEQLGYQSENATWRNFYLTGAMELRNGVVRNEAAVQTAAADLVLSLTPEMVFDAMAVHLDGPRAAGKTVTLNVRFTDTGRAFHLTLENSVLNHEEGALDGADATLSLPFRLLGDIAGGTADLQASLGKGEISVEGSGEKVGELFSSMDRDDFWFNIVTP